jgi:phage-related protein
VAFDAGSIIARLDIDDSDADRKLRNFQARIRRMERAEHKIKITVDTGGADTAARLRRQFATLDQQLTRDVVARQRGGGGSVLGTLMGLSSTRVAGMPAGGQAAQQSALGRTLRDLINQPGAMGLTGGGGGRDSDLVARLLTDRATRAAAGAGGQAGGGLLSGIAGGAGPGIGPIGMMPALYAGGAGLGLAALPALAGVGATAGVGLLGAGVIGLGAKTLIGSKNVKGQAPTEGPLYAQAQQVSKVFEDTMKQAAGPMLKPLEQAFGQIPKILKGLLPDLKGLFAGAATLIQPLLRGITDIAHMVLPGLSAALRATAPSLRPLLDGLGLLVRGILPGLTTIIRATAPFMRQFAGILGTLGSNIGKMFAAMAPAVGPSMRVLKAVLDVVGGLLPVIGKLAAIFARTLAPIIVSLGKALQALTPFLEIIGKLFADLAGAILADLVSAFGAISKILVAVSPSLAKFADAISNVFTVMENNGVFATLANALEQLAGPLSKLIIALVRGLTPVLPPILKAIVQLSTIITAQLVSAVTAILPPLTTLATDALGVLAQVLPAVLPVLVSFMGLFTGAAASVIKAVADAVNWLLSQFTPGEIGVIVDIALALALAGKAIGTVKTAWGLLQAAFKLGPALIGLVTNPVFWIIAALVLLGVGIFELVKHWKQVWTDIKNWAKDAWEFLTHGWGQYLIPALFLIRKVVEFVRDHWKQVWTDIVNWAVDAWHWIYSEVIAPIERFFTKIIPGWWQDFLNLTNTWLIQPWKAVFQDVWHYLWTDFGQKIYNFFTSTVPGWFKTASDKIGQFWGAVKGVVESPVKFVINTVLDGLIGVFDNITNALSLGKPIPKVYPLGRAAGGRIPGWGGGDILPALLEPGETVVSKDHSTHPVMLAAFRAVGVPGFQTGGSTLVHGIPTVGGPTGNKGATSNPAGTGGLGGFFGKLFDVGKIVLDLLHGDTGGATRAIFDLIGHGLGGAAGVMARILTAIPKALVGDVVRFFTSGVGGASSNAIVRFAESFIGKVPYVWGGTSPAGWDCSGFVQWIYNHFGIHAPRTSQEQFTWVKRMPGPVPGGLAFFAGADGTAASPGHVGIVASPATMVDAYATGFGTRLDRIVGSSGVISGFGIPPGGFGARPAGVGGNVINWIRAAMAATLAPASWLVPLEVLVGKESGGNPLAFNPSGASGMWQMKPGTFNEFATVPGGIWDPRAEGVAAIRYIRARWGSPFLIPGLMSGNYQGYDSGGWLPPGATVALNRTGQMEGVLTPGQILALAQGSTADAIREMHADLAALLEWLPEATGGALGDSLNGMGAAAVRRAHYGAR